MRRLLLILCVFTGITARSQNINISGILKDAETTRPLEYANIILQNVDSTFLSGTTTDNQGRFKITGISQGTHLLLVSMIGYSTNTIQLSNISSPFNLGNITLTSESVALNEVSVTAHNIITHSDRKLIFPSEHQHRTSTNGINLLRSLMLPRIIINPLTNEITVSDEGGAQISINGAEASGADVSALLPNDIVRIEYIDNPGVRYGNAAVVINYITKHRESGGSISVNLANSPQIHFGENGISGRINQKKSELLSFLPQIEWLWFEQ